MCKLLVHEANKNVLLMIGETIMPNICISIVTYNSEPVFKALDYLLEQLQDTSNTRIRVFDNNSKEDYKKRLREYQGIELTFHHENVGFGAAHNLNLKNVQDEYCLIYNPDVLASRETIEILLHHIENHKDIVMITPKIENTDGSQQYLIRSRLSLFDFFLRRQPFGFLRDKVFKQRMERFENRFLPTDRPSDIQIASGCFMFIRTAVFQKINGFDDCFFMYFEDYDLCNRLTKEGRIVYYPQVSVTHFWERGSHKSGNLFKIFVQSMIRYFNKWGWKLL